MNVYVHAAVIVIHYISIESKAYVFTVAIAAIKRFPFLLRD